eukprot:evm.model.scf_3446.1 EVM.evm.TU.scf_3446.1   scf_3446:9550-13411(-)
MQSNQRSFAQLNSYSFAYQARYPPFILSEREIVSPLRLRPLHLVATPGDTISGGIVGGILGYGIREDREGQEIRSGYAMRPAQYIGICMTYGRQAPSDAALELMRSATAVCIQIRWHVVMIPKPSVRTSSPGNSHLVREYDDRRTEPQGDTAEEQLLDDELCLLEESAAVVLDIQYTFADSDIQLDPWEEACKGRTHPAEEWRRGVASVMSRSGIWDVIRGRQWMGSFVVGVGDGCSILGAPLGGAPTPAGDAIPFAIRTGGGRDGWRRLHAAMARAASVGGALGTLGVGVLEGSALQVDPATLEAEAIVAPSRETLIATAAAVESPSSSGCFRYEDAFEELECEDKGFHERVFQAMALERVAMSNCKSR